MVWFDKNYVEKINNLDQNSASSNIRRSSKSNNVPIIIASETEVQANDISMLRTQSDEQIQTNQIRSRYISVAKNSNYTVVAGDNIESIAKKFKVEVRLLLFVNGLDKSTGAKLSKGQILKIPPTKTLKNIKALGDVAKSMGVSVDFVKKLKNIEDGSDFGENKFHNTPYLDKNGVKTIGIGHVLKNGEAQKLSDIQVKELLAKDLLKMEENLVALLGGQEKYDSLPQSMKEALLDMTFNKGTAIIEKSDGLLYCLKNQKYEAAINKMTNNKSLKTGQEMSGLSKRRLFDISVATKMYNGKIPQSNINTAQQVYNRGIELLRAECKKSGAKFSSLLVGYNNDVKSWFGDKIKLVTA